MTIVYLAGGIDTITPEEATGWRRRWKDEMAGTGVNCYDPTDGVDLPNIATASRQQVYDVLQANAKAIQCSDLMVVRIQNAGPGTGIDIAAARAAEIPVIGFQDGPETPLGFVIRLYCRVILPTEAEAVEWVLDHHRYWLSQL